MKKSLLKKTTAGLFTAATILTMAAASTTVLADDNNTLDGTTNEFKFTKTLNFADGVTLPSGGTWDSNSNKYVKATDSNNDLWFEFTFEALSDKSTTKTMPKISNFTNEAGNEVLRIMGFSSDKDVGNSGVSKKTNDTNKNKGIISIKSDDLSAYFTNCSAGEYVYEVTESGSNFAENNPDKKDDLFTDKMTTDDSKYEMHVIVKNEGEGTKVQYIYFLEIDNEGNVGTEKKNAGTLFNNTYNKEAGKNPDANNSKSSLGITKTVTGDYGDKNKAFDFTINLYEPSKELLDAIIKEKQKDDSLWSSLTVSDGKITEITAYIQDIENYATDPSQDGTAKKVKLTKSEDSTSWVVTEVGGETVTNNTFQLTDGQYLTFVSLPAGFKYDVTETGVNNYTASARIFENVDLRHTSNVGTKTGIAYGYVKSTTGDYIADENQTTGYRLITKTDGDVDPSERYTQVELNPVQQRLYAIANNIQITYNNDNKHSYPVWIANTSANKDIISVTDKKADQGIVTTDYTSKYSKTSQLLIGEHDNSFDVINAFDDENGITPTGLIVKNLPFIVMIGLGVLAFLGLTKKRRAND